MTVEYIRLTIKGLDIQSTTINEALIQFIDFLVALRSYKHITLEWKLEEGLKGYENFKFGSYSDLLFGQFNSLRSLGVKQTTYELLSNALMKKPCLGKEVSNSDWDKIANCKIDYGLQNDSNENYCTSEKEWQAERIKFYAENPDKIDWSQDEWFPNKEWSERLLKEFINDRTTSLEGASSNSNDVENQAHDKLSRMGAELQAKISVLGADLCLGNFYFEEKKLSEKERKLCGGSRRRIFSITKNSKKQYISLDFAHGMFEYHNSSGEHLGEYGFLGRKNSDADKSHNLKSKLR